MSMGVVWLMLAAAAAFLAVAGCMPRPGIDLTAEPEQVVEEEDCLKPYLLGAEYLKQGLLVRATRKFQDALYCDSTNADAWASLGYIYREQRRIKDAEDAYRRAVAIAPDSISFRAGLGWALIAQGKREEGIEQYMEVTRRAPNDAAAHRNMGFAYEQVARAIEEKAEAQGLTPGPEVREAEDKALAAYRRAMDLDPDNVEVLLTMGALRYGREDYEEAIDIYDHVLELRPDDYRTLRTTAWLYLQTKQYPQAAEHYARLVAADSTQSASWLNLAAALDNHQQALRTEIKAAEDLGEQPRADSLQVVRREVRQEAEAAYRKVLELEPDRAQIYWKLGDWMNIEGRYQEAIDMVKRGLALNPQNADELANAYCTWAKSLEKMKLFDDAIAMFQRALDLPGAGAEWTDYAEKQIERQEKLIEREELLRLRREQEGE
jgi:tetratricopeptide (TPR) repeat protein